MNQSLGWRMQWSCFRGCSVNSGPWATWHIHPRSVRCSPLKWSRLVAIHLFFLVLVLDSGFILGSTSWASWRRRIHRSGTSGTWMMQTGFRGPGNFSTGASPWSMPSKCCVSSLIVEWPHEIICCICYKIWGARGKINCGEVEFVACSDLPTSLRYGRGYFWDGVSWKWTLRKLECFRRPCLVHLSGAIHLEEIRGHLWHLPWGN